MKFYYNHVIVGQIFLKNNNFNSFEELISFFNYFLVS